MERSKRSISLGILILSVFHLVGIVGLLWEPSRALFQMLVPMDLLLSALVLGYFHRPYTQGWVLFFLLVFTLGWGVEILGVNTGWPFGLYSYGEALGPKLWGTPPLIGLNWLILVYATGMISLKFPMGLLGKVVLGAILMTFLDLLIEPVAIKLDFWYWNSPHIPVQNYLSWFLIACIMHLLFQKQSQSSLNPLAFPLFLVQVLFFFILGMLLPS